MKQRIGFACLGMILTAASSYSTGTVKLAVAMAAFNACVAREKAAAPAPLVRWTAATSGTMQLQRCEMQASNFVGVEGLKAEFSSVQGGELRFSASADERIHPGGGVLRVELPGAKNPWLLDTEKFPSGVEPRAAALRREFDAGKTVRMSFTPRGAKAMDVMPATESWPVASAMFDACVGAMGKPAKVVPYTELRHTFEEKPDSCELGATYQLHGNGIWLVLTTEGGNPALKVTHRTLSSGYKLFSVDLRSFGGSADMRSPDIDLAIDAAKFAAVRKSLVGKGVDFGVAMSSKEGYTMPFGGEFGRLEAAMFEACVAARSAR